MDRLHHSLARCHDRRLCDILETAGRAAIAAGEILRKLYATPLKIRHKGRIDLVTEADLAAEKSIMRILHESHPEIAVLAEESAAAYQEISRDTGRVIPETAPDSGPNLNGPLWVIDPLDGTTNFAHSYPWFAVSIGYMEEGRCMAGVIYNPVLEEFFCAVTGGGAWLNGQPIQVSHVKALDQALLATGFPYTIAQQTDVVMALLQKMLPRAQGVRRAGAAALDLAYVACGRLDGFWEINLKPWDTAAGIALLNEAGGRASDFSGGEFSPFKPEILSSNGRLHAAMQEIVASP